MTPNTPASPTEQDDDIEAYARRTYEGNRRSCYCPTIGRICCGACFGPRMLTRIDELRSSLAALQAKHDALVAEREASNHEAWNDGMGVGYKAGKEPLWIPPGNPFPAASTEKLCPGCSQEMSRAELGELECSCPSGCPGPLPKLGD